MDGNRPAGNVWKENWRGMLILPGLRVVRHFERQLTDNGYLVLKFFMQIDKEEQTTVAEGDTFVA